MSAKDSKETTNKSWLFSILALTLVLTLIWVLSLRAVRIKIGDYYFNQGKFDQAANWYEKVVIKEKLMTDQHMADCLKCEEDLFKLESSLCRGIEERLLTVSQCLGLRETNNLKSLFSEPKLFLKDINQLVGSVSKEKLNKAKEELAYLFEAIPSYNKFWRGKNDHRELKYLTSVGYFYKGIIDEIENNFISAYSMYEKTATSYPAISSSLNERKRKILLNVADEYLFRSPLNWFKAKELYEISLKSGNVGDIGIYLKLGYIHAKLNNFSNSFDFFKKAAELLDPDLKKNIAHFKSEGAFFYPDVLRLIPQELIEKYPFLKELSFLETKNLLNMLGIEVSSRSDGFIGKTGIKSPVEIIIRSAGHSVGIIGQILINGKNISKNKRGYNIAILNPETGEVENSESFDTCGSKEEVKKMIDFINYITKGRIVCAVVFDEASRQLSIKEGAIFEEIGAKGNLHGKSEWSHGIIGVKGAKYGEAIEAINEKPIEIYVIK